MSPSRSPTFAPVCASAIARFAATVLFPTPPFPDPTPITCTTPSRGVASARARKVRPAPPPPPPALPRAHRAHVPGALERLPVRRGILRLPHAARRGDGHVGHARDARSEERRVGKECRSR